jgi:hypothetical protein
MSVACTPPSGPRPRQRHRSLTKTNAICTVFIARLANYPVSTNRIKNGNIARPLMTSISSNFQPDGMATSA